MATPSVSAPIKRELEQEEEEEEEDGGVQQKTEGKTEKEGGEEEEEGGGHEQTGEEEGDDDDDDDDDNDDEEEEEEGGDAEGDEGADKDGEIGAAKPTKRKQAPTKDGSQPKKKKKQKRRKKATPKKKRSARERGRATTVPYVTGSLFTFKSAPTPKQWMREHSVMRVAEEGSLSRFTRISDYDMARVDGQARTSPNIRIAASLCLSSLLVGGVKFRSPAKRGTTAGGGGESAPQDARDQLISSYYRAFLSDVHMQLWEYGFAAWIKVPDERLGFAPRVLPLAMFEVYMHVTLLGDHLFVYREKKGGPVDMGGYSRGHPSAGSAYATYDEVTEMVTKAVLRAQTSKSYSDGGGGGATASVRRDTEGIVPGVFTIAPVSSRPSRHGRLRSTVIACLTYESDLHIRRRLTISAETARAAPAYFTEHNPEPAAATMDKSAEVQKLRTEQMERQVAEAYRTGGEAAASLAEATIHGATSSDRYTQVEGVGPRIDLPRERKFVSGHLPEAPVDLIRHEMMAQSHVLQLFGINPVIIQAIGTMGKAQSTEAAIMSTWYTQLHALKATTEEILLDVYRVLYGKQISDDIWDDLNAKGEVASYTADLVDERIRQDILLPGMADEKLTTHLYETGLLAYSAYMDRLIKKYSYTRDEFNPAPKPPQTVYEPPVAPAAAGGGSKAGAKKPTATQTRRAMRQKKKKQSKKGPDKPAASSDG
jgi:hypothetical protein